jgi:hypothetical protein
MAEDFNRYNLSFFVCFSGAGFGGSAFTALSLIIESYLRAVS